MTPQKPFGFKCSKALYPHYIVKHHIKFHLPKPCGLLDTVISQSESAFDKSVFNYKWKACMISIVYILFFLQLKNYHLYRKHERNLICEFCRIKFQIFHYNQLLMKKQSSCFNPLHSLTCSLKCIYQRVVYKAWSRCHY